MPEWVDWIRPLVNEALIAKHAVSCPTKRESKNDVVTSGKHNFPPTVPRTGSVCVRLVARARG